MLSLFNTLSRTKEPFEPLSPPLVTMYNCGPTVYNYAHLGNLRGYVNADVLRRLLEYYGFEVRQIINITDVGHLVSEGDEGEDKIEKGARRESKSVEEIIRFYTEAFLSDIRALNIDPKKIYRFPRATEHIPEQIGLIQKLESKGYTYRISDGIYFDTSKYSEYGALARLDRSRLKEGARVEVNPEKRNPTDFALWKFSGNEKRLQEWDSPWGVGFPGWHIECSAMAMKYLGETLDIHTGGIDHIPVHHTNEIAQSVCATGKKFARFWIHHEFVTVEGAKMAKSAENFLRLQTILDEGYSPIAYRFLLLQTHYRSPLSFSFTSLESSARALERLVGAYGKLTLDPLANPNAPYAEHFMHALNDDLNTAEGIAVMWRLIKDENVPDGEKRATLFFFDSILGLGLNDLVAAQLVQDIPEEVTALANERQKEKEAKNYARADELRSRIESLGFAVKDTKEGYTIERR